MTEPMQEIIERIEKATGPDREINALIYIDAVYPYLRTAWSAPNGVGPEGYYARISPNYTDSIDAAMTLVPEGMDWRVGCMTWASGITRRPEAAVFSPGAQKSMKTAPTVITGATPALALCAAALRAHLTTEKKK